MVPGSQLEDASAEEALTWAYSTYGDRAGMSTAFGPSGVVLMHLEVVDPTPRALVEGDRLHVFDPDRCCALRKVEPTQRVLAGLDAWLTALRRDQGPTRARTPVVEIKERPGGTPLAKVAPLARWTRKDVWRHIFTHELPYNALHDRGFDSVGCAPCTRPSTDPADERSGRWVGHAKTECGLHTMI